MSFMAILLSCWASGGAAMDTRTSKAFDFSLEVTKQLVTLAMAILVLTVTFLDTTEKGPDTSETPWLWVSAWIIYILSVVFGILTMMALTGTLEPKDKAQVKTTTIRQGSVVMFSCMQIVLFVVGTACVVALGTIKLL